MKRAFVYLLAAALLLSLAALAESDGWVLAKVETTVYAKPAATAEAVVKVPANSELEYLGKTEYDEDRGAWYNVSYKGQTGWVSAKDVQLKWSTLY